MKTKKLFIVFSVLILLVVLLVPILADDVREYRSADTYNLPERFSLDREDAIDVPERNRANSFDYFYPFLNQVQSILGLTSVDYSHIYVYLRDVGNSGNVYFSTDNTVGSYKNSVYNTPFAVNTVSRYHGEYIIYRYDSSYYSPVTFSNSDCYNYFFSRLPFNVFVSGNEIAPVAVYYTSNGVDFARCSVDTEFETMFSSGGYSFVYAWNTGVNNSSMYSFFLSISSWVHDNTLLPLDIAERLVTIIFLTVFYLVVIRLPMYFLYMRDKEGRIRGKWVDVFYFCFCVSYMCAPLWIGVFNL